MTQTVSLDRTDLVKLSARLSGPLARLAAGLALVVGMIGIAATPAAAVPAFAAQTGQPCQTCHVGGLGPQLTPFGRDFKLHGYTMRSGSVSMPFSAMAIASYLKTQKPAADPAADYSANNNTALDQVSLFFAGGLGQHLGAFVQTTYDGIAKAWTWDNVDIRTTTTVQIMDDEVLLGASLNNSPTVQDVWNTLPAWGFPYTSSGLAPSPTASPMLAGSLAQTSLGVIGYAWINSTYYAEFGAYGSPGAHDLSHLGADPFAPGDIKGLAPYGRVAVQNHIGSGTLEVGAFGMTADIHPGRDRLTGQTDRFTDLGFDAAYQTVLENGDTLTANGKYLHERQSLDATCALAAALSGESCARNSLNDLRADVSYYWHNKIGASVQAFKTTGTANDTVYADNRTGKPDSSGVTFQIDATPWGDGSSPLGARFNTRVGVQYTAYQTFNGVGHNYNNAGANASDNNTLRVFTWIAY